MAGYKVQFQLMGLEMGKKIEAQDEQEALSIARKDIMKALLDSGLLEVTVTTEGE